MIFIQVLFFRQISLRVTQPFFNILPPLFPSTPSSRSLMLDFRPTEAQELLPTSSSRLGRTAVLVVYVTTGLQPLVENTKGVRQTSMHAWFVTPFILHILSSCRKSTTHTNKTNTENIQHRKLKMLCVQIMIVEWCVPDNVPFASFT